MLGIITEEEEEEEEEELAAWERAITEIWERTDGGADDEEEGCEKWSMRFMEAESITTTSRW